MILVDNSSFEGIKELAGKWQAHYNGGGRWDFYENSNNSWIYFCQIKCGSSFESSMAQLDCAFDYEMDKYLET